MQILRNFFLIGSILDSVFMVCGMKGGIGDWELGFLKMGFFNMRLFQFLILDLLILDLSNKIC